MIKDFLKNSAIYGVGKSVALALGFFTIPIITRQLSPVEYGVFDLLNLALILLNLSVALEISQAVIRHIADTKDTKERREYVSSAFYFSLLAYAVTGLLITLFATPLSQMLFKTAAHSGLVLYLVPWLFLQGAYSFITNQFRWENMPKIQTLLVGLQALFLLVAVYYFLMVQPAHLTGLVQAYLCALALPVGLGLWFMIRHRLIGLTFSQDKLRHMILFSLPLVPSSLAVFALNYIDRIMISQMLDMAMLGLYGLAFKVASLLLVFAGIFQMAIVPLLYKHYKDPDGGQKFGDSANIYLFFLMAAFVGVHIFTPELFTLFIGAAFRDAQFLLPYLLSATLFSAFYVFAPGLSIAKKTHIIALINITGMCVNFALNLYMIRHYGLQGAAIATLASAIFTCVINIAVCQRHYRVAYHYGRIFAAGFLCIAVLWLAPQWLAPVISDMSLDNFSLTALLFKTAAAAFTVAALAAVLIPQATKFFKPQ